MKRRALRWKTSTQCTALDVVTCVESSNRKRDRVHPDDCLLHAGRCALCSGDAIAACAAASGEAGELDRVAIETARKTSGQ